MTDIGRLPSKNISFCPKCATSKSATLRCTHTHYVDTLAMKNHGESARILGAGFFFADPDHEIGIVNLLLVLLALRKHPNKQAVFLDVGMNTGFFSNLMAAQGAEVHAFETQPRCFKYASSALSASGLSSQSVFLYNAGLTDSPGSILQSTQGCDGSNNALSKKSVSLKHIQSWGGGSKRVPTFVLDDSMPASCAPHAAARRRCLRRSSASCRRFC